jgi:predicted ATPase
MPEVTITLLGGFAAAVDGEPVAEKAWRLKKARELVKLLALAPEHRLHREQAMDLLWRDRDPAAAANNLHQAVHAARRALDADAIEVRDELLRLHAEVDVERFERAAVDARRAGTPAAFRAALSLYGGELLPENRYEDWAMNRRDELAQLHAELTGELDGRGAVERLRGLPVDVSSFVGREHELAQLHALLARTRLLTLAGTGGAGKTRLAVALARAAEPSYADGAVLVELAAVADPALVADAVAASLDVRALPGLPLVDAVADFLASRTLLLVLDNCEHVLGAGAAIADVLLRGAPELTIVATSRESLRVPGEVVFRVPSLALPDPEHELAPADLLRYEAVRLFVERAAAAAPGFELDADNAADVAHICFRLDGLPLALELAAARLGALGAKSISERLDDRFRLLRSGSRAAPTRQQTLAATLQWSHDLLETDERVLLRRLSVFAGGFELSAVEAVCAADEIDVAEVPDVLARLVEKSLVSVDDSGDERRYRLLETVRLYARDRLADAGETDALALSHAAWAIALAQAKRDATELDRESANLRTALDTLLARDPTEALRLCALLWPFWLRRIDLAEAQRRFAAALDAAPERTRLHADALRAVATIDMRSGMLAVGREHVQEALEIAVEIGDRNAEWQALHLMGGYAIARDDGPDAAYWFDLALELARREGFAAEEATCIYSLGVAAWTLGELARAEDLLAESIAAYRALAGSPIRVPSPANIGELRNKASDDLPLRIVFEETLQPFVEVSCEAAAGYALLNQAGIARIRGDLDRTRALLAESEAAFEETSDVRGRADVQVRRAYLALTEGSAAAAREHLEQALELRRSQNDRRGVGLVLTGLCLAETVAGEFDVAEAHVAEACELFRRAGDRWGLASALWRAADLGFARGRVDDAEEALAEARLVVAETGRDRWIAHTLVGLAEVAVLRGDADRAVALFTEARDRYYTRATDAAAVAHVEQRLASVAKRPQRARKGRAVTTPGTRSTKGRQR